MESVPRARIMAAARKRFKKCGYRATSIALIARDAGIAVGTIYLYFRNKKQILVALFDESNARWMAEAERAVNQPGSAEERLLRVAQASMERNQRDQLLRAVMNRDLEIILDSLCEEFRDKVLRHNVEVMADIIRDGVRSGEPAQPIRKRPLLSSGRRRMRYLCKSNSATRNFCRLTLGS